MVALSKSVIEKQRSTMAKTKLMISFLKVFLVVVTGAIIGTNFGAYELRSGSRSPLKTFTQSDNSKGGSSALVDKSGSNNDNDEANNIHVVFSTACSLSHDWQSYLFFFHAMLHGQKGTVTRIVSGCSPEDEIKMRELHEKQFSVMNPNFLVHFTPEYGKQLANEGFNYQQTKYWNKPFGLKHWMENHFGYKWSDNDEEITVPEWDDHIIVLVDPDMLMQRPFVNDFSNMPLNQWNKFFRKLGHEDELVGKVTQGHPAAQDYSFGSKWMNPVKEHLTDIVGPDSPVHDVTEEEARFVFAAGPPYWMTARDAFRISHKWAEFLPGIFRHHPVFMAEMYGYCMAAAHLGLRHQMARGMMISNVDMAEGEGWAFLPKDTEVCDVSRYSETVPHVVHFCQRYSIGDFFINKYLFPTEIFSCEHPLLELPPMDIMKDTWFSHYGDGSVEKWPKEKDSIKRYRNAFMICSLFPAVNAAAKFYKDQHCKDDPNTVYDLTWNHFRSEKGIELEKRGLAKAARKKKA
mmetsp:Transcript_20896/g.58074  ORF Transcript_20896/g.58074 Transcript_20896/m.58074 type:complete len:518 (-) Transcript_20896:76-1629(-)|eukprot:CAMPEP_0172367818 /NCGR_PEP_ID=MMETSP1060-20121228/23805_1 /TAXON_ID=37318 /ORGANISM="Pseudo-nitzschia pungens, Strain cf. cingulata" /LENGTH=517 /DNA_ID=CAMNT_0013092193 /DNA_START=90 /DNA_END=1643 /DNA_ORIENTATION=-